MLRNRIAQDGGRNRSIKVGNQGNDMSYSFSASYGITREQWNQMTTQEQDEFVWAQRSKSPADLERERVEAAIQSYKSSLAGIKAKALSNIEDTDGSVSAYFDRLINARIEAFSQEALGNMPSGMQAVNMRYAETVRAKIPALLGEISALLPSTVSEAHREQFVQQSQAQLKAVQTAERLRAQHVAEITNYVVGPGGGVDLKKALRYLTESTTKQEEGSLEQAARAFETWAGRVTPLMQDEALDIPLRNRISAKFESVRAAFDALGPDSRIDDRLAAMKMMNDFEYVVKTLRMNRANGTESTKSIVRASNVPTTVTERACRLNNCTRSKCLCCKR